MGEKFVEGAGVDLWQCAVAPQLGEPGGNAAVKRIADFGFADAGGLLQRTHGKVLGRLLGLGVLVCQANQLEH
ncbi:hypothetical protein D3C78_1644690 [compost metagenome]